MKTLSSVPGSSEKGRDGRGGGRVETGGERDREKQGHKERVKEMREKDNSGTQRDGQTLEKGHVGRKANLERERHR